MQLVKAYQNYTVSHGTLRVEDLAPAFVDFLKHYAPKVYKELNKADLRIVDKFGNVASFEDLPEDEQDSVEWFLNEILFDKLNDIAPKGYYFGSHPGDGSDFGFWKAEMDV